MIGSGGEGGGKTTTDAMMLRLRYHTSLPEHGYQASMCIILYTPEMLLVLLLIYSTTTTTTTTATTIILYTPEMHSHMCRRIDMMPGHVVI